MLSLLDSISKNTTAIELSPKMAELAHQNSPNSIIINDDVKNINFVKELFDLIFAGASIHMFPTRDVNIVLQKFYEWLKSDGKFIFDTTMHDEHEEGIFVKDDYKGSGRVARFRNKFTEDVLDELLFNNGFEVEERIIKPETDRDKKWMLNVCKKKPFKLPVGEIEVN